MPRRRAHVMCKFHLTPLRFRLGERRLAFQHLRSLGLAQISHTADLFQPELPIHTRPCMAAERQPPASQPQCSTWPGFEGEAQRLWESGAGSDSGRKARIGSRTHPRAAGSSLRIAAPTEPRHAPLLALSKPPSSSLRCFKLLKWRLCWATGVKAKIGCCSVQPACDRPGGARSRHYQPISSHRAPACRTMVHRHNSNPACTTP